MKLKTRITKDFYKYFDEARGIAIQKRKVLKNKNSSCFTYTQIQLIVFIIMLIVGLLFMLLGRINYKGYVVGSVVFLLALCYIAACIVSVVGYYNFRKNCSKKGLVVDENGVANVDMECPYCISNEGYTVIGKITPFEEDEPEDEAVEEPVEEPVEEVEETEIEVE